MMCENKPATEKGSSVICCGQRRPDQTDQGPRFPLKGTGYTWKILMNPCLPYCMPIPL